MASPRDTRGILADTEEMICTAELGLADLLGDDPRRRMPGLRNVAVFGRAVTNVLQNLRSEEPTFDDWYGPQQERMRADPLLKYFYDLRSEILKEGTLGRVHTELHVERLDSRDLAPLMRNPPPGAQGFFVGDELGGSGWEVQLPDGSVTKYYVRLPDEVRIQTRFHFEEPPGQHEGRPIEDTSAQSLARHYVEHLRELVGEAKRRFAA